MKTKRSPSKRTAASRNKRATKRGRKSGLTVRRRTYEYEHEYGLKSRRKKRGKAIGVKRARR